jgi:hypothetical protein
MSSENQMPSTTGADAPARAQTHAGSPIKLLVIIGVLLAALLIFGALDR